MEKDISSFFIKNEKNLEILKIIRNEKNNSKALADFFKPMFIENLKKTKFQNKR